MGCFGKFKRFLCCFRRIAVDNMGFISPNNVPKCAKHFNKKRIFVVLCKRELARLLGRVR